MYSYDLTQLYQMKYQSFNFDFYLFLFMGGDWIKEYHYLIKKEIIIFYQA